MTDTNKPIRPIRSFVIREGRMTAGQRRALSELWHKYGLNVKDFSVARLQPEAVFERVAPTFLEIGFGNGGALFDMARQRPDCNFIGVEVHRPGVGKLLLNIEKEGLSNIRVFQEDGNDVLADVCCRGTLQGVNLFFPDPWHKKKHHKRRILQPRFIELVTDALAPGGRFHFASDWEPYAMEALELLQGAEGLTNCALDGGFSERPSYRPLTRFEQRGLRLGHGVWDIIMKKPLE